MPGISYCLRHGYKFLVERSIHVQFLKLIYYIPYDFLKLNFSHFTLRVMLFFVKKKKPKIFGFNNVIEIGIRKILTFVKRKIASKIFGNIILKPLKFRKDSKSPKMTEQLQVL